MAAGVWVSPEPRAFAQGGGGRRDGTARLHFSRRRFRRPPRRFWAPDIRAPGGDGVPLWRSFTPARLALKAIPWQRLVVAVGGSSGPPGTFGPSSSPVRCGQRHTHRRCHGSWHVAGAAPCAVSWPSPVDAPSWAGMRHHTAGFGDGDKVAWSTAARASRLPRRKAGVAPQHEDGGGLHAGWRAKETGCADGGHPASSS